MANQTKGDHPKLESASLLLFIQFIQKLILKVITEVFSEKALKYACILVAIILLYSLAHTFLLPVQERANSRASFSEIADSVSEILENGLVFWSGWVMFAMSLFVLVPLTRFQWKRIQSQGKQLRELRDSSNPDRVSSSREESFAAHEERMKRKYGPDSDN